MRRTYRWYLTVKLFLGIVWRVDWTETRMPMKVAWSVARTIHPRRNDFREDIYRRNEN